MSDIEWGPDPRTVQACIDALPYHREVSGLLNTKIRIIEGDPSAALQALLPKPDPDVDLVRKVWAASDTLKDATDCLKVILEMVKQGKT